MTENSQPPVESNKRGNIFLKILKKVNFFGRVKNITENNFEEKKNIDELLVESLNTKRLPSLRQMKYLPRFLSKKEKIIMRFSVSAIIICLILIGYVFLKNNLVDKPAYGGTYTENLVGYPQNINPLYAQLNEVDRDLSRLVFAGLLKEDASGQLMVDLAKEWFVDEAKTKYTFKLKEGVEWPDGEKFTSDDVLFTIETIQNPDYKSPLRASWTGVQASIIDEYTVQFSLPAAYDSFLTNLTVGILPVHLWQDIFPENAELAELNVKPVGLGPYKFDSFVKDKQGFIKSYTLVRNEKYHQRKPYLEEITFKFQPTFEAAVESLKNKNSDGLSYLPQNLKDQLETRKDLNYYFLSLPQYTAIFFNQSKNNALADKKVRQALNLSISKEKILTEVLNGQGQIIDGPILPGMPGYEERGGETFNVEEAKKLLAEAGWKKKEIANSAGATATTTEIETDGNGLSKFLYKDGQELAIQLTTTNQPQSAAIGELIQKYWQSVGVRVTLANVDISKIQKDIITERNFEALMFGEILGSDLDLYPFWHSSAATSQGLNIGGFRNESADKLLEAIRKETNQDQKASKLKDLQKIIKDELPAIFLYNPNYTYVVANKIKGITIEKIFSPSDRLNNINDWYIKSKKGFK